MVDMARGMLGRSREGNNIIVVGIVFFILKKKALNAQSRLPQRHPQILKAPEAPLRCMPCLIVRPQTLLGEPWETDASICEGHTFLIFYACRGILAQASKLGPNVSLSLAMVRDGCTHQPLEWERRPLRRLREPGVCRPGGSNRGREADLERERDPLFRSASLEFAAQAGPTADVRHSGRFGSVAVLELTTTDTDLKEFCGGFRDRTYPGRRVATHYLT
jgi:hypothetical protein